MGTGCPSLSLGLGQQHGELQDFMGDHGEKRPKFCVLPSDLCSGRWWCWWRECEGAKEVRCMGLDRVHWDRGSRSPPLESAQEPASRETELLLFLPSVHG